MATIIALIRSLLFMAIIALLTVVVCAIIFLCFWMPHHVVRNLVHLWTAPTNFLIRYLLGISYELRGAEHIVEPAVILCKHQSAWETIVLQEIFPDVLFVWIDRGAGKDALRQLHTQGALRLSQNYSVAIFPEGTRVAPGHKRRYKIGGASLAVSTGAPLLPIALNSGEVWGRNALLKRPGKVIVSIGPRIDTKGLTADQTNVRAEQWIENEMRRISPHLYANEAA